MSKRIYTAFSFSQFIWSVILRLAALFGLIYSLPHFDENPIVISIVVLFCFLAILFFGDDQIVIYSDKVVQTTNSFASFLFNSKDGIYEIENIKSAYLQPVGSIPEIGTAILLFSFLLNKNNSKNSRPIFLD